MCRAVRAHIIHTDQYMVYYSIGWERRERVCRPGGMKKVGENTITIYTKIYKQRSHRNHRSQDMVFCGRIKKVKGERGEPGELQGSMEYG